MASWAEIVKGNIYQKESKPQKSKKNSSYLDEKVEFINKYNVHNELCMKGIQDDILTNICDFIPGLQLKNPLIRNVKDCNKLTIPNKYAEYSVLYYGRNIFNEWNFYCPLYYSISEIENIDELYYSINYNLESTICFDEQGNMNSQYHHVFNIQFYRRNVKNQIKMNNLNESYILYSFEFHLISNKKDDINDLSKCSFTINNIILRSLGDYIERHYITMCFKIYEHIIKHFTIHL